MPRIAVAATSRQPDHKTRAGDQIRYLNSARNVIELSAAAGEVAPFQVDLAADDGQVSGLEVRLEPIVSQGSAGVSPAMAGIGEIPLSGVAIYRHWPIRIERFPNWYLRSQGLRRPRDFPDALVPVTAPRHGQPFTLPAGDSITLWIDLAIPHDTRPGLYQSALLMTEAGGTHRRTPLEITVRPVALNPALRVPIIAGVQLGPILAAHTATDPANARLALRDDGASHVLHRAFEILHAHGLDPMTREVRPGLSQNTAGAVELDWSDYDAFCGPLIDGSAYDDGRAAFAWPLPVDLAQPDPARYGGLRSAVYAALLKDYLAKCRRHVDEQGWLDRAFVRFDLPLGDNPTTTDVQRVRDLGTIVRSVDPALAFVSGLVPQPMADFGWHDHAYVDLSDVVNIWATPARYVHPATLRFQQTLGKRTWLAPDRPPFSGSLAVEAPPLHPRSLPWQAFIQRHEAILLERATDWPADVLDAPITDRATPTDTWLLYPGSFFGLDEPIPSVRLKQLRLGAQEAVLLRMLASKGRGETARLLARSLIKAAGTDAYGDNFQDGLHGRQVESAAMWELARTILLDEVCATTADMTLHDSPTAPRTGVDPVDLAWREFLQRTRNLTIFVESARLRVNEQRDAGGYHMSFDVAVRSELRTPVTGELKFGPLPPGVERVSDTVQLGPIDEMELVRGALTAAAPALPRCDHEGHARQEILFDAGNAGVASAQAVIALAHVPSIAAPLKIDGDLADWTPFAANVAGGFRLINAYEPAHRPRRPAESQTIAYFCHDAETLYIGLHAEMPEQARAAEPHVFGNVIEYEDLMPLDADLVEILIDPTNQGTQSEDLYHIVIKSTGDLFCEKGVGMSPPIGRTQPWTKHRPRYIVRRTSEGWSAELAIPLAAFGPAARRTPIWGINLMRLEPLRGEYSDWAYVPRHGYDPRTLGNLFWEE